jgi:hypothetical protein
MGALNRHYKHLLDPDIALLLDFQADHFTEYINWEYDVRVGPGRDPGSDTPAEIRKMALDLSRRRIDCIAEARDHVQLIEICQIAQYRPIAQLPIYAYHYIHDFNPAKPVQTAILCREMPDDIRLFCDKVGYRVYLYPPDQEPPTT